MMLGAGVSITTDAIFLAIDHQIDIIMVDGQGKVQGRVWSAKFGSISTIRKQQVFFASGIAGGSWLMQVLAHRLQGGMDLLKSLMRDRPAKRKQLAQAIGRIQTLQDKISNEPPRPLDDELKSKLRGWEGAAGRTYFQALGQVVPEAYRFAKRSRRPSADMANCCLNYLYGMLYGQVELALIKAGIDPYIGVFHRDEYNRPVLVYDFIEKYRVWAEAVLLKLCFRKMLDPSMFSQRKGGLWLETEGKRITILAMNDFLNEVIQLNGKRRSRLVHLQEDAHGFAKIILEENEALP
jgi:CRISPR-associated protein Cas1